MSEHVERTIEMVQKQVRDAERDLSEKKRMVNTLCGLIGRPPLYADAERAATESVDIRSDEFYGQPLATVVRRVLEKRKAANLGAATAPEIFEAMKAGGYDFGKTGDANSKRNLRISLTKNSAIFHRLPGNRYGMLTWYPNVKPARAVNGDTDEEDEDEGVGLDQMQKEFGDKPADAASDSKPQAAKK